MLAVVDRGREGVGNEAANLEQHAKESDACCEKERLAGHELSIGQIEGGDNSVEGLAALRYA